MLNMIMQNMNNKRKCRENKNKSKKKKKMLNKHYLQPENERFIDSYDFN